MKMKEEEAAQLRRDFGDFLTGRANGSFLEGAELTNHTDDHSDYNAHTDVHSDSAS